MTHTSYVPRARPFRPLLLPPQPGASRVMSILVAGHGSTLVFPHFVLFLSQQLQASSPTQETIAIPAVASTWSRDQVLWWPLKSPMVFPSACGSVFSPYPILHCCLRLAQGPAPGLQVAAVGGQSFQTSFKVRWNPTCQPPSGQPGHGHLHSGVRSRMHRDGAGTGEAADGKGNVINQSAMGSR